MGAASRGLKKAERASYKLTIRLQDLPPWGNDNSYILTGYRRQLNSYWLCLLSCLYLHNETGMLCIHRIGVRLICLSVNIWTHAIEAAFFVCVALAPFSSTITAVLSTLMDSQIIIDPWPGFYPTVSYADTIVVYTFLLGAIALFAASSAYHCFKCHSERVCTVCSLADHLCIIVLIIASFVPGVYYAFYCRPELQILYISMILVLGTTTASTVIDPRYRTKEYKRTKARMYLSTGLSGLIPVIHCVWLEGYEGAKAAGGLSCLLFEATLYIVGGLVYAERVPERIFPGLFDVFGHSHSLFHCCVNAAAIAHYYSVSIGFRPLNAIRRSQYLLLDCPR